MSCRCAKSAGQDAPPTEKENDIFRTSYALLFKRNGISSIEIILPTNLLEEAINMAFLRVRLSFPPSQITEPVIYNIGRQYNIVTNIRRANVTAEAGWVVLEITGEADELERAVDHLRNIKVEVEPVEGDVVQ